ncbi:IclR family transcriptional regulator [Lacrimispora amygdalina]|uniref:IclR family transcriptional regulator n=1 Tax=Lacrimispora amygdalina TaxID=253257 RepID=UPI000BE37F65|nr:IclR family transcriptional regulator [Lacrimispora amygdalina]
MPSNEHRPTERVLDILELLSTNGNGMTLTELSKSLNAPKSSIMPLVHTMTTRKFIYMNPENFKYFIGIAAFSVGSSYTNHIDALEFIKTEMRHIVAESNETCQLGIQSRSNLLYIAKEDSSQPIRLVSYVGKQLPLYCTAIGRAILADMEPDKIYALYPDGLTGFTPYTITQWPRLLAELEETKKRGFALEHEESTPDVHCVGVSLCNKERIIAALSVSIPSYRYSEEKLNFVINLLKESKATLEAAFSSNLIDLSSLS